MDEYIHKHSASRGARAKVTTNIFIILIGALWLVALAWLVVFIVTLHGLRQQRFLLPTTNSRLTASDAPLVSILVPARNEENRVLADCIRSILAQDYGRFEVIAV